MNISPVCIYVHVCRMYVTKNVLHNLRISPSLPPQIIEWFEEYAEEFFETHTELGENLEVAIALVLEVQQFEDSTEVGIYACRQCTCVSIVTSSSQRVMYISGFP